MVSEINNNYHNYRVIKYYKRGVGIDIWNDERKFFELNLTNRNKLLNEYNEKISYSYKVDFSGIFISCWAEGSDYDNMINVNTKFKNSYDYEEFNNEMKYAKEYHLNCKDNNHSTFNQYIVDFKITNCDDILTNIYGNIFTFLGRTLYLRCKLIKQIMCVKGFIMMNYFLIQDKAIIKHIIDKVDVLLKNYTRIFANNKKVFLPYVWYDENKEKMILCSTYKYKAHIINDHILSSQDIVFKLENLKINKEIDCLFDFDIVNCDVYSYINLTPICIY